MFTLAAWRHKLRLPGFRVSLALCVFSFCLLAVAIVKPFRVADAPDFIGPAIEAQVEPVKLQRFQWSMGRSETGVEPMKRW